MLNRTHIAVIGLVVLTLAQQSEAAALSKKKEVILKTPITGSTKAHRYSLLESSLAMRASKVDKERLGLRARLVAEQRKNAELVKQVRSLSIQVTSLEDALEDTRKELDKKCAKVEHSTLKLYVEANSKLREENMALKKKIEQLSRSSK